MNDSERIILLKWIYLVCHEHMAHENTFALIVSIIDRAFVEIYISRSMFQLCGLTSLRIAYKINEYNCPTNQQCIELCDGIYTGQQFKQMEALILNTLDYRFHVPTVYSYLESILFELDMVPTTHHVYISDLSYLSRELCRLPQIEVAAAVIYLVDNSQFDSIKVILTTTARIKDISMVLDILTKTEKLE